MKTSAFTPVFEQLKDIVRTRIAEGHWKPGEKIDSERQLAEAHGLARLTVTRALEELIREGLLERRNSHGTFVTADASRLLGLGAGRYSGQGTTVGFAVMDVYRMTHPYFAKLVRALADHYSAQGRALETFSFHAGDLYFRRKGALTEAVARQRLSGVLLAGKVCMEDLLALRRSRIPLVRMNNETPEEDIPCVLVDYAHGAFEMTRRMIALGHRRIALLLGTPGNRASYLSRVGYHLAHTAAGLAFDEQLVTTGHFDEESGYLSAMRLLRTANPPTAIQAADDLIACGVLKAAQEIGREVPRDLSVGGCGNLISPFATSPALATSDINFEALAVQSAQMLANLVAGRFTETRVVLPPSALLDRGSLAPPAPDRK